MTDLAKQPAVVEQCDRDAAEWFCSVTCSGKITPELGAVSSSLAAAFARHRLAERERCAKVAETQFEAREWHPERRCAGANIAGEIRTAIRSGKEPAA